MRLKLAVPMLCLLLLCACGAGNTSAQTPIAFRTSLNDSGECSFRAAVTADYGEYIREFLLDCQTGPDSATLTVMEPEVAMGITAEVSGEDASVSYDGTVLAVEDFSSRRISPMAAPYILSEAWRGGYISATGRDGEYETVEYLLGYGLEELTITTYFSGGIPVQAEISDGEAVLIFCGITELAMIT